MKSRNKTIKLILLLLIALSVAGMSGCWDGRDIEDLAIIIGMGVDQGEESEYLVTFQVARPEAMGGGDEGDGGGIAAEAAWTISIEADSVFDAVRRFRIYSPWELFFGHMQVIVIGEDVAERGVGPIVDFFQREVDLRRTVYVAIAKGQAMTILDPEVAQEQVPSMGLVQIISVQERHTAVHVEILGNFVADIDSKTAAAMVPGLTRVKRSPDDEEIQERRMEETAVFRSDKLVGWLTELETRGALWIRGEIEEGVAVIIDPIEEQYVVNIDITRARTDVDVELMDGEPVFTVKIIAEGRLASQTSPYSMAEPELLENLETRVGNAIQDRVTVAHQRALELEADFLTFGNLLSKRYPHYWQEIQHDWISVFKRAEVKTEAKFEIRQTGFLIRPIDYE